ncbi:hypothetical protein NE664_05760 [Anaerotignum faecicola]|nr:hypothetical protein [Anaerotignum faecicola]
MIKTEIQMKETEVISKVYCNVCGREIKPDALGYYPDFLHIEKTWNYFSGRDGETQKADICERCWNDIVENFKIKTD